MLSDPFRSAATLRADYERVDWAATPLGPVAGWSPTLLTTVDLMLGNRFPVTLLWGPELVLVYNQAYVELIADKHPVALGSRAKDIFPEAWDTIGPMLHGVLEGSDATWSEDVLLPLDRSGFLEECYFSFSYSAVRDPQANIVGVIDISTETTASVVVGRRLQLLSRLSTELADAEHVEDVPARALAVLAGDPADLPAVDVRLAGVASPTASAGCRTAPPTARGSPGGWSRRTRRAGSPGCRSRRPTRRPTRPCWPCGSAPCSRWTTTTCGSSSWWPRRSARRSPGSPPARPSATCPRPSSAACSPSRRDRATSRWPCATSPPPSRRRSAGTGTTRSCCRTVRSPWWSVTWPGTTRTPPPPWDSCATSCAASPTPCRRRRRGCCARSTTRWTASTSASSPPRCWRRSQQRTEDGGGPVSLRWSNAGHPPPVLIAADGRARLLATDPDLLLGLDHVTDRADHAVQLGPGDSLLIYTDGLVERRGVPLQQGLDWLVGAVDGRHGLDPEELCDHLLGLIEGRAEDDIALLVVRSNVA